MLPELGDNSYELWLGDPSNPQYIADVIGGSEYFFSDLGFEFGIDFFRVLGVEEDLDIVPGDVTAFVTGLTFEEIGEIRWRQSPLYYNNDDTTPTSVHEPGSIAGILSISGLILIRLRRRRR